jgi:signal peptidase I
VTVDPPPPAGSSSAGPDGGLVEPGSETEPAGMAPAEPAGMFPAEPARVAPAQPGGRRAVGCLFDLLETLVLTLLLFLGLQTFVVQPYQVKQESMEQTLDPGDYVLVDKLTPHFDPYKRGDIVVFAPPPAFSGGETTPFIKRIVAVGGDLVEIRDDGYVYVNGRRLDEPYLYGAPPTDPGPGVSRWLVPPGDYFVLGDHRNDSADSRIFGPISGASIIGRAWLRYWPPGRMGLLPAYHPYPQGALPGAPPISRIRARS